MKIINLFRFTLFVLSVVFSANIAFAQSISTPDVSATGDGCNTVSFKVANYDDIQYTYTATLNGASVSLGSDGSYTVASPVRDVQYTLSVSCTERSTGVSSSVGSTSATLPKAVETPKIKASTSACDAPVVFTITSNYNNSLNYTWNINGNSYPGTSSSYTVTNPVDGATYEASVSVTDNCTSAVSSAVSQTYIKSPAEPQISVSHRCGSPIVFKLDNNSAYPATYTQVWKINGSTITPTNGEYSFSNFSDGTTYTLNLEVSNSVGGVTCKNSANSSIVAKSVPNSPRVTEYKACAEEGTGIWEELVAKSSASNTLVWYESLTASSSIVAPVTFDKNSAGKISYWVAQKSPAGCESGRSEVKVTVYEVPEANAGHDLTICEEDFAILAEGIASDANVNYVWSPSAKLESANSLSVKTKPLYLDAEFTLTASNKESSSCKSQDKVKVFVLKKPIVSLSPNKFTICEDGSVTINNTMADPTKESYSWEASTDGSTYSYIGGGVSQTLSSLSEDTNVKLIASLDELPSCATKADATITVVKRPVADAGPDKFVCYGSSTQIGTGGVLGVRYKWDNAGDLNNANIATPTINRVTEDKVYTLTVSSTAVQNCESTSSVSVYKVDKPTVYTLSGGGSYCNGSLNTDIDVILSGSDTDTEYMLVKDDVPALPSWTSGTNTQIVWSDVTAGNYRVKARKIGYDTCEELMSGLVVVKAESSPEASIRMLNSTVACPGDEVTVRVEITGGVPSYKFTLLTNDAPREIKIDGNFYDFQYTPTAATVFKVSEVSDAVCKRVYDPSVYIPTLDMQMSSLASFTLKASKSNPVCFGDKVNLYVDYNEPGSKFIWESGEGGNSISIDATQTHTYELTVETPEGCKVPAEYTVEVAPKQKVEISGFTKTTNDGIYFLCSNDPKVLPVTNPVGGKFSTTPAGFFDGSYFDPSQVSTTTDFEVKYQYTDVKYGCNLDTVFHVTVSAINKEVNWTLAPTNEKPNAWATSFQKCQPNPANPKDVIKVQGHPQVAAGEWYIQSDNNLVGGASVVEINEDLAEAQVKGVTAGVKYFVSYKVTDNYGCTGISTKDLIINSKPTTYVESGGILISPNPICINNESATIKAAQNPGKFSLSRDDNAMYVGDTADGKGIEINPSLGKAGDHKIIYTVVDNSGCKYSESAIFTIVNPVSISSFDLPKKEFCSEDDPVVITVSATVPTTGYIKIVDQNGVTVLDRIDINNSPVFDPGLGEGQYTITYVYNDGTCDAEYSEVVVVNPTPVIDMRMKDDYCYGEKISILPNYSGGEITLTDPLLPVETLVGYVFNTEVSGLGQFTIEYKVKNEFGCEGQASKTFQVRGVENMTLQVAPYICEPAGLYDIEGAPKPQNAQDKVYFSTVPTIGLTDNGDGTGLIDLSNSTYNTIYPVTYHYVEEYLDENGDTQTCESTITKNFKVLDQTSDFIGFKHNEVICSDEVRRDIEANFPENTRFEFSHLAQFPTAFVDNGDGTAILSPSELPEGFYTVTMYHEYFDPVDGTLICSSKKTKSFFISKIEEVKDISLYCHADNKTSVKLENTELGIRYDLYVNGGVYDAVTTTGVNEIVEFKAIDVNQATAYVVAVDPNATSCSLQLSKEFVIEQLSASVTSTNISCFERKDGTFKGSVRGGELPYNHRLLDTTTGAEVLTAQSSILLGVGKYTYEVTDGIGCVQTADFEIVEPNKLVAKIEQSEVDCYGATTATLAAQVQSNAGVGPYKYTWEKIESTGNVFVTDEPTTVVAKGEYQLIVEDANGCIYEESTTVTAPDKELTIIVDNKVDVQVIGDATGKIEITVTGGTQDAAGLYKYTWTGISIDDTNRHLEDLDKLKAGTYSVLVEDARGCKKTASVTIFEPTEIRVQHTIVNPTCFGFSNGVISLTVSGGTQPYNFEWTNETGTVVASGEGKNEVNGLVSGEYNVMIKDADGNIYQDVYVVLENPELVVTTSLLSVLENKCYNDEDGVIILDIKGGTNIYTVDWGSVDPSKLQSDNHAIGLGAKIYNIDVKDSNGCQVSHSVEVTQPNKTLSATSTVKQNKCYNATEGEIDLIVDGGTPNYRYIWQGVGVNPTAEDQISLTAGEEYSVKVYDANGCSWEGSFTMDNPQELILSLTSKDITCNNAANGTIEAQVTGEAPFTYTWENSFGTTVLAGNYPKIENLSKDMYNVTVTDKLGCTKKASAEVKEPDALTAKVESKNISCNNANDGQIKVFAEGGSGIFTYALYKVGEVAPITTSNEIGVLEEGAYQYKVQDENGCNWTSNVINIINPDPIVITYNVTDVSIYGLSDGIIDLDIVGGTPSVTGYQIQWVNGPSIVTDPSNPAFNADKEVVTGLKAGRYNVVVTDENNCAAVANIVVNQPEVITLDIDVKDVDCHGQTNGKVVLSNLQGGTAPYTITFIGRTSGVSRTDELIIDALPADVYDLKVIDVAGAEFNKEIEVKQPDEIVIKTVKELSKLSVDCFGNATGEIKVDITGGTAPYNYNWVGVTATNVDNVKDLATGTYAIMLTDAKNCTNNTYKETIAGPVGPLDISEHIVNNKCYGESNASIEISVTGGTAPYTYLWTGAGIEADKVDDQNQYSLYNGQSYKVTVIDDLNCTLDRVYKLDDRIELQVATSSKDVLCNRDRTGELHATISGGTGPVSYGWESSDGSYSSSELDINTLYAGKYIFKAKDSAGCEVTKEEIIDEPDVLTASLPADFALCGGIDDGELYVTVDGGTKPYTYLWHKDYDDVNPVGFGAHLTNLGAGIYQVFIKDRNGCEASDDAIIKASVPMNIIRKSIVHVSYNGFNDGSIEIEATGGTDPLTYTWSGPTIDPNVPVTGQSLTHLVAGYYYVTVEDAVGCKITERFEITQPEELTVEATIDDIKCAGDLGKILLRVDGGTPNYTYEWTSINGYSNSTKDPEVTDLLAGVYDVTIKDSKGAETKRQYIISQKDPVEWTLLTSKTELDCFEQNIANINLHVVGGTLPYSIEWKGPDYTNSGVYSIGNLGVGTYTAEIIDANGCKPAVMFSQEITQPTEIVFVENLTHNICTNDRSGKIELNITGGVEPYSFTWSGFDVKLNEQNQENLPQGVYTLYFSDANNCEVQKEYKIQANNEISAIISGPSDICSREEFNIQIDVNGQAPWIIEYTDGFQTYSVTTEENINIFTHSLLSDSEFKLISVVDANGCSAKLSNGVQVDVHEIPQITIVSAQEDCCLGEPALVDIIFAGKGPWTISYTDGTLDYIDGPFTADRDYLKIIPTQIGTKTYTIKSVSNNNCSVPIDYSVDITAYTYPNLEVNVSPYICEPNPLQVSLHATGEAPWHLVYYLNDLKYEYDMQAEDEVIDIYPNKPENVFLFESIKSGKRCVSKLDKTIQSQMGLLPLDATVVVGQNMVCRGSVVSFSTSEIPYATSYKWSFPSGFNIVSGLGSTEVQVQVSSNAQDGEIRVWGVNSCGEGVYTAINVQVDKPMSTGAEITIPPFVCDNESLFPLTVSEVENATNYEWIMPTGYTVVSGQGTRSVMVKIDKYAVSSEVQVIPSNICTEANPIKAKVEIRPLPFAEAGVDFITNCSTEAVLMATNNANAITSEWRLVSGNAAFENTSLYNTKVSELMYGDNVLAWTVDDGFCVGYDLVTVTNQNPGLTQPEFSELTICEDFMTLRAGKPEFGMGRWTLIAGDGEIQNPNSNETLITGLSNKRPNVIRWEVYSPQCSNSVNVEVISHDLNKLVDAGSDGVSTTGSYRLSARIVNDAEVTGTWTVEAGSGTFDDPHNPNTVISGLSTGINTIRWTLTGYDCIAYDEIKIRMVDEPIASFNIETTEGCVPLTVQFTNTTIGNADYKWEFGDGSSSDLRSPIHIFENPGTYTVKLTASANGRVDTYTGEVNVLPSPEAAFSVAERQLYVPNAEAHFYSETDNGVNHYWLFGDGGSSDKANPVYTYLADGLYDVTYIVSDINLCSDTLVMEDYIKVGKDSYLVFPTAFTPNVERSNGGLYSEGERRLDVFYPVGRNVDTYKLEIFSTWGNKVFESNDQYIGWDGYYMGQCAAQGVYLYRAEGRFKDGNSFQYSGNLMLIR